MRTFGYRAKKRKKQKRKQKKKMTATRPSQRVTLSCNDGEYASNDRNRWDKTHDTHTWSLGFCGIGGAMRKIHRHRLLGEIPIERLRWHLFIFQLMFFRFSACRGPYSLLPSAIHWRKLAYGNQVSENDQLAAVFVNDLVQWSDDFHIPSAKHDTFVMLNEAQLETR